MHDLTLGECFFLNKVLDKGGVVIRMALGRARKGPKAKGSQMSGLRGCIQVCKTEFVDASRTFYYVLIKSKI